MTGRYAITAGDPKRLEFVRNPQGEPFRTNSLSDAIDKVESLSKWVKVQYTICIISELSV